LPSEIHYCDKCGMIILPSAIESGAAAVSATTLLCPECLKKLSPDEREAMSALRAGAGTPDATPITVPARVASGRRRPRESEGHRAAVSAGGTKARAAGGVVTAVAVGIGAAVVSALVGIGLLTSGDPEPPRGRRATPTVGAPAGPSRTPSPSGAAPASGATGAARQLARIRAVIAMDDSKYAEARGLLVQFPKSFAGKPEVEGAKALLSEIDAAYARRAEEAFSSAREAARGAASLSEFDEAESGIRSIKDRFGDGPWFESKGEAAVAEALSEIAKQRSAWELENVAGTLEKAREEFRAGRFEEAGKLIANRAEWPTDSRAKADELATGIERAVAAAAAAKKLAEERAAVLAEFDRLMTSGEHAGASDYAKSKLAAGGEVAAILRGGERLAKAMTEEPAARIRGARTLVGRKVRLKLASGHKTAIVKAVTDTGVAVATTYTINNRTRERPLDLKWGALHADQKAELARLGGLDLNPVDKAIMATYAALASDDLEAAGKAADAAGDTPLGKHLAAVVRTRVNRRAYESAMRRARELVERKKLKDAALECEKALDAMPDDKEAATLLAEVRRLLEAPKTLTLDLGNGVTMEFVYVKPGTFVMGGESTTEGRFHAVETPKHTVTITKGFYLGKYEVTQAQYQAVMGKNPSKSTRDPNCPVDNVSWQDANAFCKRAAEKTGRKVRLPTEAEWEYACRAGTDTDWSHGSDPAKLTEHAWTSDNSGGRSHPVGQKKPNPWGLYDIHGNVCERVADMYHRDYYANSPKEDPTGADVGFAAGGRGTSILRGGTWKSGPERHRCGSRLRGGGYGSYDNWGFRAAVTAPEEP